MVKQIYVKNMTDQEWHDLRSKYITASISAQAIGCSQWGTATELYYKRIGQPLQMKEKSEASIISMMVGTALEPTVARLFEMKTGKATLNFGCMYISEKYPWMACNPDFLLAKENAALECKTTSAYNKDNWDDEKLPMHVLIQAYHQKIVMELDKVYVCGLIGNNRVEIKEVTTDEYFENLIIEGTKYFVDCVERKIPPAENSPTSELIRALFPTANEQTEITLSEEEFLEKIIRYDTINKKQTADDKLIEAEKLKLKYDIMQAVEDNEWAYCGGKKINCRMRKDGKRNFLISDIKGEL